MLFTSGIMKVLSQLAAATLHRLFEMYPPVQEYVKLLLVVHVPLISVDIWYIPTGTSIRHWLK